MKKAIFIIIIFAAGCSEFLVKEPANTFKLEDFEEAWRITDEWYPFFEFKNIDWDSIYQVYLPRIEASKGDEYILVLHQMINELKDGHMKLILKNGSELLYEWPRFKKDRYSYSGQLVISKYINEDYSIVGDEKIGYGMLENNIGYIRIAIFLDYESGWIKDIDIALKKLANTDGLIIDVRHNRGGSVWNSDFVVRRFLSDSLQTPYSISKGEIHEGRVLYPNINPNYQNNVVVLVNGVCFSTTEHFASDIQQIDHVVLVGDTTGGGSGNPEIFDLPSGMKVRVSRVFYVKYDEQPYEWNGIVPDYLVPQTETDINNRTDKQLEFALEYLKTQ